MHQSRLSFAATLSSPHSHSQSELSFDHSVSILWSYPFCLSSAKLSLIWLSPGKCRASHFDLKRKAWINPPQSRVVWLICYQATAHLLCAATVQKPVSNATSRPNSNTSRMAYCECDVSYTLSSSTLGRLPSWALWEGLSGVLWLELPVISQPQQHGWQDPWFCRKPAIRVHMCGSGEVCMCMCVI